MVERSGEKIEKITIPNYFPECEACPVKELHLKMAIHKIEESKLLKGTIEIECIDRRDMHLRPSKVQMVTTTERYGGGYHSTSETNYVMCPGWKPDNSMPKDIDI